jgi:hypothetical protein
MGRSGEEVFGDLYQSAKEELASQIRLKSQSGALIVVDIEIMLEKDGISSIMVEFLKKMQIEADMHGVPAEKFGFLFLIRLRDNKVVGNCPGVSREQLDRWLDEHEQSAAFSAESRFYFEVNDKALPDRFYTMHGAANLLSLFGGSFNKKYTFQNILLISSDVALLREFDTKKIPTARYSGPLWDGSLDMSHLHSVIADIGDLSQLKKVVVHIDIDKTLLDWDQTQKLGRTVLNKTVLEKLEWIQQQFLGKEIIFRVSTARSEWSDVHLADPAHVSRVVNAANSMIGSFKIIIDDQSHRAITSYQTADVNWKHLAFVNEPDALNILLDDNGLELGAAMSRSKDPDFKGLVAIVTSRKVPGQRQTHELDEVGTERLMDLFEKFSSKSDLSAVSVGASI